MENILASADFVNTLRRLMLKGRKDGLGFSDMQSAFEAVSDALQQKESKK